MSTALKRNSCRLPTPGSSPKEVEGGMMDINLPKHVRYACEYWVDHLMGTKSDTRAQYVRDSGKVHSFLEKDYLHWLEAMSLMGKMPRAVLMITEVARISELGRHRSLHAITEDARRFILRNRAIIEEAPLQTYVSALVFSPAESLIRKCYLHEVPSWVNRLPATDVGWGNFAQTLKTNGKVRALAFSPDGRYLACGVKEVIQLWDTQTGALHSTLEGHQARTASVVFLHDGTLVSYSMDNRIRVWEPIVGVIHHILDTRFGAIDNKVFNEDQCSFSGLSLMPNGDLAILCGDHNIRIWSWEHTSFSAPVNQGLLVISLFGCLSHGRLVFGTSQGVFMLDTSTLTVPAFITIHTHLVAISPDDRIAWCSYDDDDDDATTIFWLFNTCTKELTKLGVQPDVFQVLFIEFCPDGTRLITGRYDNTVTFWDLSTQAQSFVGIYTEEPLCVAFSHNDQPMVAISDYNIGLGLWDLSQKSLTPTEPRREIHEEVYSLQFSPRGTFIAVSTKKNCMLKLYNTGDYQLVFACDGLDTITLSPSDEHLAAVCPNGTILWHPSTETDRHILVHGPSYVSCLAFSSDGKQLAIGGSGDSVIRIWDPKTKALRHKFEHAQSVSAVTFSLDGARLASLANWQVLDNNMTARLWDISTENLLYESDGFRNPDGLLAISPNNKYITHCYHTESVSVYDLESKERQNFGTGTPYVADLAFSGDSQYVAFTHSTETGLYDINNLQQVAVFPAERLYYGSMSLSADGKYLENYRGRFRTRQLELDIAGGCPKDVNCWSCRDQWIVEGETKMLWLPPEFQRFQTTHHNGLFAFKHENGYRLLGFSQDPGVLDEET
ncbi:MAG: hypothetical protein Q9215_006747 [Flavoplaca cf. flavocitrina]